MIDAILALQKAGFCADQAKAITELLVTKDELENAVVPLQKIIRAIAEDVVVLLARVFHLCAAEVRPLNTNSLPLVRFTGGATASQKAKRV